MFCCFCRSRTADDDDDYATSLPPAPSGRKHAAPSASGASAGVHEFASQMAAADDRVAMSSVAVLHAAQIRSIRSENAGDARPVGTPPSRGGSRGATPTPRDSQRSPGIAGDWSRSYQGQSTPGAASGVGFGSNAAAVGSGVSGSGTGGGAAVHSMSEPRIASLPGATGDKLPVSPLSGMVISGQAQGSHHHAQYAHQGAGGGAGTGVSAGVGAGGGGGGGGGAGGAVVMAGGPGTQRPVPLAGGMPSSAPGRARILAWLQESDFTYAVVNEVENLPMKLPSSSGKGTSSGTGDSDSVTVGGGDSSGGTNSTREGSHDPARPSHPNPDEPVIEKLGSFLSSLLNGFYDDASSPAPPPQPGSSNQPFDPFASSSNAGSWRRQGAVVTLPGTRKDLPPAAPTFGSSAAGGGGGGAGAARAAATDSGGLGVGRSGAVAAAPAAPAAARDANAAGAAAAPPPNPASPAAGSASRNPSAVRTWKDSAGATLTNTKFHSQARPTVPTGLGAGSGTLLSPAAAAAAAAATAAAAAATMAGAGEDRSRGAAEPCALSPAPPAAAAAAAAAADGGEGTVDSGAREEASAPGGEELAAEADVAAGAVAATCAADVGGAGGAGRGAGGGGAAVGRGREREKEGLLVQALTNLVRQNGAEGEGRCSMERERGSGEWGAQVSGGKEAHAAGEQESRGVGGREARGGGESEPVSRSVTEASAGDLSAIASTGAGLLGGGGTGAGGAAESGVAAAGVQGW
ncbi:hypothetical protein CLOM_g21172 [Closterium sp. NIES-68]|nr:hypothetical protein CLOM_g21172 [Closterium sp. NIES-68]GJP86511.1 hypothetical protein CLOP_g16530 [Closterium sp. NIES-67]